MSTEAERDRSSLSLRFRAGFNFIHPFTRSQNTLRRWIVLLQGSVTRNEHCIGVSAQQAPKMIVFWVGTFQRCVEWMHHQAMFYNRMENLFELLRLKSVPLLQASATKHMPVFVKQVAGDKPGNATFARHGQDAGGRRLAVGGHQASRNDVGVDDHQQVVYLLRSAVFSLRYARVSATASSIASSSDRSELRCAIEISSFTELAVAKDAFSSLRMSAARSSAWRIMSAVSSGYAARISRTLMPLPTNMTMVAIAARSLSRASRLGAGCDDADITPQYTSGTAVARGAQGGIFDAPIRRNHERSPSINSTRRVRVPGSCAANDDQRRMLPGYPRHEVMGADY